MKTKRLKAFTARIFLLLIAVYLSLAFIHKWLDNDWEPGQKPTLLAIILWLLFCIVKCTRYIRELDIQAATPPSRTHCKALYAMPEDTTLFFFLRYVIFKPLEMGVGTSIIIMVLIYQYIQTFIAHNQPDIRFWVLLVLLGGIKLWQICNACQAFISMCRENVHTVVSSRGIQWLFPDEDSGENWLDNDQFSCSKCFEWKEITNVQFFDDYVLCENQHEKINIYPNDMDITRQIFAHYFQDGQAVILSQPPLVQSLFRNKITFDITPGKSRHIQPGQSKIGGSPDVPENFTWPVASNGHPLSFIMQTNCADASPLDTSNLLPKSGFLYVFYNIAKEKPEKDSQIQVIYTDTASIEDLHREEFPQNLCDTYKLSEYFLKLDSAQSLPTWNETQFLLNKQQHTQLGTRKAYELLVEQTSDYLLTGHMLGYADLIEDNDFDNIPDISDAILLFQFESITLLDELLDGTVRIPKYILIYIRKSDLARRDFSKIWSIIRHCD